MKVGIVGGGMMGVSLGYFLTLRGAQVDIYECSPALGGLAASITLADGTVVDRYYHVILSRDVHIQKLCQDLNLSGSLRFHDTRTGFYHHGKIYSMNNIVEFLKFPPLGWMDRFRLGLTVLYAQFFRDWKKLDGVNVEKWLNALSGRNTFVNIWRPLLRAKFDGGFEQTPATYIWSRLVRMKSTRSGVSQKEQGGHLMGGYSTLIHAMAKRVEAAGGKINLSCPVEEIHIEQGKAVGLKYAGRFHPYDAVVSTLQVPLFARLIPGAGREYLGFLNQTGYLGIISGLLVLDRPLTGYWTLYITHEEVPFTGVIETTTYIDPRHVGGHHLVYLPKYTAPGSSWQDKTDAEIQAIWLRHLKAMIPQFNPAWIYCFQIHREQFVEPLHPMNEAHWIPAVQTPIENLYLVTSAQIYPGLTNSESIVQHAEAAAQSIAGAAVGRRDGGKYSKAT